ncbi:RNA polymerase [Zopfochytrium polystomum]|nr:RNA polymerase [Zopfochytrium polystomum]
MSRNEVFTDIFEVNDLDQDGKKFDRVSRIKATSESADMEIILDINSEIYPMRVQDKFTLTLALSLSLDGGANDSSVKRESWREVAAKRSLADDYEYVMFGKVYKYDERERSKATVYASFGGLLLCMSGDPVQVNIGQEVYLLLRKNS